MAYFTHPQTKKVLARILDEAKLNHAPFQMALFKILITNQDAQVILKHLEIDIPKLKKEVKEKIKELDKETQAIEEEFQLFMDQAFLRAKSLNAKSLKTQHLLLTIFEDPPSYIEDLLLGKDIELSDAVNVARWLQARNRFQRIRSKKKRKKIKHNYMNRAWTAKPTQFLDQFSTDLTDLARAGQIGGLVGHQREVKSLLNILTQKTSNNALLVGKPGSGRNTIIEHIARRIFRYRVPDKLKDLRIVSLNVGSILAGVDAPGDLQKRLQKIQDEILASKNIVLAIPKIHNLIKAAEGQQVSFMSFFGPIFQEIDFPVIASTDPANHHQHIEQNSDLAAQFTTVKTEEISQQEAIRLLMAHSLALEKEENVTIGYYAVKEAVRLAARYIHNRLLPGSALDLLKQAVGHAKGEEDKVVTKKDIRATLSIQTGIPITEVSQEEAEGLLNLEEKLHERLINQKPAVQAVAETLRQARTGLGRKGGPTGTFLFVGPTGVGKTELAKTLAANYFGGEERMLRFDMSEYQSQDSIYRLIGSEEHGGFLTEKVKKNPFSLVLLDEFEKAHPDVLNLFLQVFEDGRITDESGREVNFTETIIICTSNAHSRLIQEKVKEKTAIEEIRKLLKEKLNEVFKPELINRFDDVIVFTPLTTEQIKRIAHLKLDELFQEIEEEKGIKFSVTEQAVDKLAELGYDPEYGARPLRRIIRKKIRSLISRKLLEEKIKRGKKYIIDFDTTKFIIR